VLACSQSSGTFELAESVRGIFTVLPSSETVEGEESHALAYCAIQLNERALQCLLEKAMPIYVRCYARVALGFLTPSALLLLLFLRYSATFIFFVFSCFVCSVQTFILISVR
jgi:hypothetical protein